MTTEDPERFEAGVERALERLSDRVGDGIIAGRDPILEQPTDRIAAMRRNVSIPPRGVDVVRWELPPSKSHLIRWLVMAAQGEESVDLLLDGEPGEDAASVARALDQMGVAIDRAAGRWTVHGVGPYGLRPPVSVMNLDDCGTGLRIVAALAARFDVPVMLDGNVALRRRPASALRPVLRELGCELSAGFDEERLPLLIEGPIDVDRLRASAEDPIELDVSRSSQPFTALLLSGATFAEPLHLRLNGESVSSQHAALSIRIAQETGAADVVPRGGSVVIEPWRVVCPREVRIPNDRSQEAFAILLQTLHSAECEVIGRPESIDSLGCELLDRLPDLGGSVDLTDASDLISPLTAILALTDGGTITGAAHARGKESDRLTRTVEVLARFGIDSTATDDGLRVRGGQTPSRPEGVVDTHADHRLHMTAACLATSVGATLSDAGVHAVSDPGFMDRVLGPRV